MSVSLLLSNELKAALAADEISAENYGPAYGGESVGLDLYNAGPSIVIPPSSSVNSESIGLVNEVTKSLTWLDIEESTRKKVFKTLMPTGIRMVVPHGYGAYVRERGSVSKTPLTFRAGVIDPGYTGPVWVNIINVSNAPYVLEAGAKSPFQIVVLKTCTQFGIVDEQGFELAAVGSRRKEGQIGSSDRG